MASRAWLVNAFKQRVDEANDILSDMNRDNITALLGDEWGGIMNDMKYFTQKGKFRKNAKLYNKSELENLINILDSFINDAPVYHYEGKELKTLQERLGISNTNVNANIMLTLLEYMKNKVSSGELSSYQMRDIIRARLENGQGITQIKEAFDNALQEANGDPPEWFNRFSENGNLI